MCMKKKKKNKIVYAVYACLGCMPSSIRRFGFRVCGHKKDTVLKAPLLKL